MTQPAELLSESGSEERLQGEDEFTPAESVVERLCRVLCEAGLVAMVVIIGAEVIARALFHYSFEISDEVGGYVLVAISFLSLPVSQVHHGFHHVEFVQARLSPLGRAVSRLAFDLLCLGGAAILLWQLGRLEVITWQSEDVAPTILATPLWLPRLAMPVGAAVLCATLVRTLAGDLRRLVSLRRGTGR